MEKGDRAETPTQKVRRGLLFSVQTDRLPTICTLARPFTVFVAKRRLSPKTYYTRIAHQNEKKEKGTKSIAVQLSPVLQTSLKDVL